MSGPQTAVGVVESVARMMSEKQLQQNVIEMAERLGYLIYHTFDSRRSQPGFPDLVIIAKHRILYVELKRHGKKLTPAQEMWRIAIEATKKRGGHEYHLWHPMDWLDGTIEDVLRIG